MSKMARNTMAMMAISVLGMGACIVEEQEPPEVIELEEPELGTEARIGTGSCAYYNPPRCGPRNCVAECVTCSYDICRINGGSCSTCKAAMEDCKDSCAENNPPSCPPWDPFC